MAGRHAPLPTNHLPANHHAPPRWAALPTDPSALPDLDAAFHDALDAALERLSLELSPGARAAIEAQVRLLVAWLPAINLSGIRAPDEIAREHVVDSLSGLHLLGRIPTHAAPDGIELLDLGSGAGYPGLPLAVSLPTRRAALVDSVGKKAAFLRVAADAATAAMREAGETPPQVDVHAQRAEELAAERGHRERWTVVVARAVGDLGEVGELGLPLLRRGGSLFAWKRDDGEGSLERELAASADRLALVGAPEPPLVERVLLPELADHRLVVLRKTSPTPRRYPRHPAERKSGRSA